MRPITSFCTQSVYEPCPSFGVESEVNLDILIQLSSKSGRIQQASKIELISGGDQALRNLRMPVVLDKSRAHQWPAEPAVFRDFPFLISGQSYEDWTASHDLWMASLSPVAKEEVTAYRNDVDKYLRSRTWKIRRQFAWDFAIVAMSTLLLGSLLNLFDGSSAEPFGVFLFADSYQMTDVK